MKNIHNTIFQVTDLNGVEIEVTDLTNALMMAKRFIAYRHIDKAYIQLDKKLFAYWTDLHEKLLQLQTTIKN